MTLESFITATDKKLIAEKFRVTVRYIEMVITGERSDGGGSLCVNKKAELILNCVWMLATQNQLQYEAKREILGLTPTKPIVAHEANSK